MYLKCVSPLYVPHGTLIPGFWNFDGVAFFIYLPFPSGNHRLENEFPLTHLVVTNPSALLTVSLTLSRRKQSEAGFFPRHSLFFSFSVVFPRFSFLECLFSLRIFFFNLLLSFPIPMSLTFVCPQEGNIHNCLFPLTI